MITIKTWPDLRAAIEAHPAREILVAHADRLEEFGDQPLADLCEFILVEPTDHLADLEARLSMSLHPPPWEYVDSVGGWFEFVVVTGQAGEGFVVLIEDRPDNDQTLLNLCRAHAD